MIKVTKIGNKTIYLNAHKIKCIYQDPDGDTYIEFDVGGLHVEQSLEDVLEQIDKILLGSVR
tara:strand:- start:44 stop:229 length:186 start_codon:yes stop_codon:yes gene_type:complete